MRHNKQRHHLGVRKEHRSALLASLVSALFRHDRITTTLGHAKALRPFAEKVITLAKKAAATEDSAIKLHYRRNALSKVRDESVVHILFTEKVSKFLKRPGGYTRIYKLIPRAGDAAEMAIIELIEADDEGYKKAKEPAKKAAKKATKKAAKKTAKVEAPAEAPAEEKPADAAESK